MVSAAAHLVITNVSMAGRRADVLMRDAKRRCMYSSTLILLYIFVPLLSPFRPCGCAVPISTPPLFDFLTYLIAAEGAA